MIKRFSLIILLITTFFLISCSMDEVDSSNINDAIEKEEQKEQNDEIDEQKNYTEEKNEIEQNDSNNELTVHYIDANQGDATLFQYEDYTILYDTGDWKDKRVIDYLNQLKIDTIDLIIISHPHADHIGQLEQIIQSIDVDEVWMTENVANTKVFQGAIEAILNSDAEFYNPEAGETFDIGSMELLILHPETLTNHLNEDSLSVRFTYGDVSFVFTGDAYKNEEQMILNRDFSIEADFLQLGHHGSNTSSDPSFIEAVDPVYAIYSAGEDNQYGHPHAEVVNYFEKTDIKLLGTDVHGTITVTTDGKSFTVTTERDGSIVVPSHNERNNGTKEHGEAFYDGDCIDINEATTEQLTEIIHIGSKRVEELVKNRPYATVDELTKINGIGDGRIADIKSEGLACVN